MARALHPALLGLCLATAALAAELRPFLHRPPGAVGFHPHRQGHTEPSRFWPTPPSAGQPSYFWQAPPEPQQPSYFWSAPPTPPTPPTPPGPKEFTVHPETIRVRESDLRKAMKAAEKLSADHASAKSRALATALAEQQATGMMFSKAVESETTAAERDRLVSKAAKEAVEELKAKMDQDRENEGMVRRAANEAAGAALKLMRQQDQQAKQARQAASPPPVMQQKSVRSRKTPRKEKPPRKEKLSMRKQSVAKKRPASSTHRKKRKEKEKATRALEKDRRVPQAPPLEAPPPRRGPEADYPAAVADIAKEVALKAYSQAPTAPGVTQAARQAVQAANAAHWMKDAKQRFENAMQGGGPNAQRGKWMDQMAAQVELSQAIQQLPNRRGAQLDVALPPYGAAPPPPQGPPPPWPPWGGGDWQAPPMGAYPRRYLAPPEAPPTEEEEATSDPEEEEEEDAPMTEQSVGAFKAFPRRYTIENGNQPAPLMAAQMPPTFAAAPAVTLDAHQRSYGGPPQSSPRETELMGAPPKSMPL